MNSDSYLRDEELLLLSRLGVSGTQEVLASRYYASRHYHARRAAPGAYMCLSQNDLGQEFFTTFLNSVQSFRFGESLFKNYLETALARDIYRAIDRSMANEVVFLGEPVEGTGGRIFMEDVVSSSAFNDPRTYINYAEEALALGKAPEELDRSVLLVASLKCEGKSTKEVMKLTGMTLKQVKRRYAIFCDYVKGLLETGGRTAG